VSDVRTLPALPALPARKAWLDTVRGLFVVLMAVYHSAYIAVMTGLATLDLWHGFWWWFPRFIASGFLFLSGYSLSVAAARKSETLWPWLWRRSAKLALCALAVSVVSALALGRSWVFFGILHCMALGAIVLGPFLKRPGAALALGVLVLAAGLVLGRQRFDFWFLAWLGFRPQGVYPADYLPLLPWCAWMFFGAALGGQSPRVRGQSPGGALAGRGQSPGEALGEGQTPGEALGEGQTPSLRPLAWLGRHSLGVYLVHLPALFGLCSLIAWLVLV